VSSSRTANVLQRTSFLGKLDRRLMFSALTKDFVGMQLHCEALSSPNEHSPTGSNGRILGLLTKKKKWDEFGYWHDIGGGSCKKVHKIKCTVLCAVQSVAHKCN